MLTLSHSPFHCFWFFFGFVLSPGMHHFQVYGTCSSCPAFTHWSSDSCLDRKIRAHIQTKKRWHLGKVFTLCNQTSFSTLSSVSGCHVSIWQGTIRFNVKPFLCFLFLCPQMNAAQSSQLAYLWEHNCSFTRLDYNGIRWNVINGVFYFKDNAVCHKSWQHAVPL